MAAPKKPEEKTVGQLFYDVDKLFHDDDFAGAQKVLNKILRLEPDDLDAKKCKIVCQVQQGIFQEAIDAINSNDKKGLFSMPFEKAYCFYRLNNLLEAEKVLTSMEERGLRENELLAQVHYRLEKYKDCVDVYHQLIRESVDDYSDEREANLTAVVAAAKLWNNESVAEINSNTNTYELCYNYACLLIANGDLDQATDKLNQAIDLCKESFDEDATEEEIEEEQFLLKAQLSYIAQLQQQTKQALQAYNQILKKKPKDITLTALISNNIIALHKEKELFDSRKRLKNLNVAGLEHKLSSKQQHVMETNKVLVNVLMNQIDSSKKSLSKLKSWGKDTGLCAIMEAAVYLRDKQPDQAIQHLQAIIGSGESSDQLRLTLAQLLYSKGRVQDSIRALEGTSKPLFHSPALTSLLVSLCNQHDQKDKAANLLDASIAHAKESGNKERYVTLLKHNTEIKMSAGDDAGAIKMLEMLREEGPSDVTTLAKIVAAYSRYDLERAHEFSQDLPEFTASDSSSVNVDSLEMVDLIGTLRFSKKPIAKLQADAEEVRDIKAKKQRKKKKGKLPKFYNADQDPDPERWLPRWERSTYKHKKQKRGQANVGKGTQGMSAGAAAAAEASLNSPRNTATSPRAGGATSPRAAAGAASPQDGASSPKAGAESPVPGGPAAAGVVPPRQQKPGGGAKSKPKKKKKGGGW